MSSREDAVRDNVDGDRTGGDCNFRTGTTKRRRRAVQLGAVDSGLVDVTLELACETMFPSRLLSTTLSAGLPNRIFAVCRRTQPLPRFLESVRLMGAAQQARALYQCPQL